MEEAADGSDGAFLMVVVEDETDESETLTASWAFTVMMKSQAVLKEKASPFEDVSEQDSQD